MGESKLPKAPKPALERPAQAITQLRMSVEASKTQPMDADTADFMRDLAALLVWIDHLEGEVAPKPRLDA
jgi:hypothetical protein